MNYQEINQKNIYKWEYTLKYLTEVLDKNIIPYYLSASGLEYILGKNIYPYDIDIFVSKDYVKKVFNILKEYKTSDIHLWEQKYLEFQGVYKDIPFEICEWEKEPIQIKCINFKDYTVSII